MNADMSRAHNPRRTIRSDADFAQMVVSVAKATQADGIICVIESGAFAQHLDDLSDKFRVVAATANAETYKALIKSGVETIRLPLHAANKYSQVRHAFAVAFKLTKVSIGDLIVCAVGRDVYLDEGKFVVLTEIEPSFENVPITELLKLTDGIRPQVLEAALIVASKVGRAASRGKRIGTIFMLGDSIKVLEGSKQLIPNPFQGHEEATRRLTNPDVHDALVEFSKLDGAFVIRGDGFILTGGLFLGPTQVETELPAGLGTRHAAAAAVTARTASTAIVISATDGKVRAFSEGKIVLQMDPQVAHGPISPGE
jgi:DNA integrity scanning protein DisA with diadenylate cyclase activity